MRVGRGRRGCDGTTGHNNQADDIDSYSTERDDIAMVMVFYLYV